MLLNADAGRLPLRARVVHCITTSPPYLTTFKYGGIISIIVKMNGAIRMVRVNCKWCGKPIRRSKAVFCNLDCKAEWQRTQKPVDREWLYQKYVTEGMGTYQIAKLVHRNPKQVYHWLNGYNIPVRKRKWELTIDPTIKPYQSKEWLANEYLVKGKSSSEIADEFGITVPAIIYWLQEFGIPRRTISEARAIKHWGLAGELNGMYGVRGEDHPGWRGGCTPDRQAVYGSPEWAEAVGKVWQRDKRTCQRCRCVCLPNGDVAFHIHHIVSFSVKELRTDVKNLVLLCINCHHWVHSPENTEKEWIKDALDKC